MPFQTRNQKIAHLAFKEIKEMERVKSLQAGERERFASMAKKLPFLVRTAGLAQAISFLEAKSKSSDADKALLSGLSATVTVMMNFPTGDLFTEKCRNANNLSEYIRLTETTLEALEWFKRFSESVLPVQEK